MRHHKRHYRGGRGYRRHRMPEEIWGRVQNASNSIRRSPDGKLLGVCQGLADYFGLPVRGVRLIVILAAVFTGFWPVAGGYVLAGLIMRPGRSIPRKPAGEEAEPEWFDEARYTRTRKRTVSDLKTTFADLDDRLQHLEDTVTAKEFDWERRYNER